MEYLEAFNIALNEYLSTPDEESEMTHLPDYKIIDVGIDHTQYFPGISSDDVYAGAVYGIGRTYSEALDDAIEMLCQSEHDALELAEIIERIELVPGVDDLRARVTIEDEDDPDCEVWYHVGIMYNI